MKTRLLFVGTCTLLLAGCSHSIVAHKTQMAKDVSKEIKKVYVVHKADETAGLDALIAGYLSDRGYDASHGQLEDRPPDVDAVVTYVDNWAWDMVPMIVKLRVEVMTPDGQLLGSAFFDKARGGAFTHVKKERAVACTMNIAFSLEEECEL